MSAERGRRVPERAERGTFDGAVMRKIFFPARDCGVNGFALVSEVVLSGVEFGGRE